MWKKDLNLIIFLTLLGGVGILAIIPYQMTVLMNDTFYQSELTWPVSTVIMMNALSQIIMLFVLVLIGVKLQDRTGLDAPYFKALLNKTKIPAFSFKWLLLAIIGSFIGSLAIYVLDMFIFIPNMDIPADQSINTVWWQGFLGMFYGGITEELMVRLFGMTLIVWVLAKFTGKWSEHIPDTYFYIGMILAALLFGLGHLPATIQLFGDLTGIIFARAILLNGLLGLWFGYLYWKKGLEYAMIAHMAADLFLHVVLGPLFN